jgi:hypothetical protein
MLINDYCLQFQEEGVKFHRLMWHIRKLVRKKKRKKAAEECNNKRMNAAGISQHRRGIG